jgi:hypothetical protein
MMGGGCRYRRLTTIILTHVTCNRYTFNPDDVAAGPLAECNLSENGALHVRLFQHPGGRQFALVTSGFATKLGIPGRARALIAVDVTDPARPREVCKTHDGVPWTPEGIFITANRGYVSWVGVCVFGEAAGGAHLYH